MYKALEAHNLKSALRLRLADRYVVEETVENGYNLGW